MPLRRRVAAAFFGVVSRDTTPQDLRVPLIDLSSTSTVTKARNRPQLIFHPFTTRRCDIVLDLKI
jgi:hypothetical protein